MTRKNSNNYNNHKNNIVIMMNFETISGECFDYIVTKHDIEMMDFFLEKGFTFGKKTFSNAIKSIKDYNGLNTLDWLKENDCEIDTEECIKLAIQNNCIATVNWMFNNYHDRIIISKDILEFSIDYVGSDVFDKLITFGNFDEKTISYAREKKAYDILEILKNYNYSRTSRMIF